MPVRVRLLPSLPLLLSVPRLSNLSLVFPPNIILPKSRYLVLHLPIPHRLNAQPNSWKNWLASTLSPRPNFFDRWTMRLPHPVSHVLPRLLDSLSHVAPPRFLNRLPKKTLDRSRKPYLVNQAPSMDSWMIVPLSPLLFEVSPPS